MKSVRLQPNRRFPAIPSVTVDLRNHTEVLTAIRESVQVGKRDTSDVLNSYVRVKDLVDMGFATLNNGVLAPHDFVIHGEPTPAPVVEMDGDTYTLKDLTPGAWHVFTNSSLVTITILNDADEPVVAAAEFRLEARGAAGVTIAIDDAATVLPPKGGSLDLETDDFAVLKRTAADEYKLVGSTAAP